ncbi:putative quinol monooxygenase [Mesobacillus harenae]|uniref:putative quinol monooxygenase n=1 Tax=Mesobacillus harenae TaxID=2213203 RepID=UPI001580DC2E|nr:putative quinol monooxygenase [Mesobacillus harenae]
MIVIHAFIKVKADERSRFLNLADDVIKGSKAEEGNISYHLYEDTKDPNTFVMVEEWRTKEAVKLHGETEHYKTFAARSREVLAGPPRVEKYLVSEKL